VQVPHEHRVEALSDLRLVNVLDELERETPIRRPGFEQ